MGGWTIALVGVLIVVILRIADNRNAATAVPGFRAARRVVATVIDGWRRGCAK